MEKIVDKKLQKYYSNLGGISINPKNSQENLLSNFSTSLPTANSNKNKNKKMLHDGTPWSLPHIGVCEKFDIMEIICYSDDRKKARESLQKFTDVQKIKGKKYLESLSLPLIQNLYKRMITIKDLRKCSEPVKRLLSIFRKKYINKLEPVKKIPEQLTDQKSVTDPEEQIDQRQVTIVNEGGHEEDETIWGDSPGSGVPQTRMRGWRYASEEPGLPRVQRREKNDCLRSSLAEIAWVYGRLGSLRWRRFLDEHLGRGALVRKVRQPDGKRRHGLLIDRKH